MAGTRPLDGMTNLRKQAFAWALARRRASCLYKPPG
jgi:hypothetical protein